MNAQIGKMVERAASGSQGCRSDALHHAQVLQEDEMSIDCGRLDGSCLGQILGPGEGIAQQPPQELEIFLLEECKHLTHLCPSKSPGFVPGRTPGFTAHGRAPLLPMHLVLLPHRAVGGSTPAHVGLPGVLSRVVPLPPLWLETSSLCVADACLAFWCKRAV